MQSYINNNYKDLIEVAQRYSKEYQSGAPFPNIHFNDFFSADFLETVLEEFPDLSKTNARSYKNKQEIKLAGKGEQSFGLATKKFMHFLNSEPFLQFLQILTGIKEPIIGDPYFLGGGQHEIKKGGLLKIHADFNKHPTLELDRRINVLVYLNKDWEESFGGHFELWDNNMESCVKKILPLFNTLAIFSTTDFSYHGHPNPLDCPENRSRKSLALYYYSNGRPAHEINQDASEHSTLFKKRRNNQADDIAFSNSWFSKASLIQTAKEITPPFIWKRLKKIF